MFQTLVCTLPKCLCKLPTNADCLTATTKLCAGQDLTVSCKTGVPDPELDPATYIPCSPAGTVCYEELQTGTCDAAPICTVPGTFAYGKGEFIMADVSLKFVYMV
jgi:hypothetical protein